MIVLEEAHNLVGRSSDAHASESNADPKSYSTQLVCSALAKFRTLGVAVVVVDQITSAVAPEVIKQTTTKLAFRQNDTPDRDALAATMLFGPTDYDGIARLLPGEAVLYTLGYFSACPIDTPDLAKELCLTHAHTDCELAQAIRLEPWFLEAGLARSNDELNRLTAAMDRYDQVKDKLHQQIKLVLRQLAHDCRPGAPRAARPMAGSSAALRLLASLKPRLWAAFHHLKRGPYRYLRGQPLTTASEIASLPEKLAGPVAAVEARRQALVDRFENVIKPQATELSVFLDRVIQRLRAGFKPKEQQHEQTQS